MLKDSPSRTIELPSALNEWLSELGSEGANIRKRIKIIESLSFKEINERTDNIKIAHPRTFEWLFQGTEDPGQQHRYPNIYDWLRKGNGTYWVSGKAGSGKSTRMKFFCNHLKTQSALEEWACDRHFVVASFFFWNAGTSLQKSQKGLLQSLLCQILRQAPELIPLVCPSRWQRDPKDLSKEGSWTEKEVLEAFTELQQQKHNIPTNFCLFIDGLDEYAGDHMDIIGVIRDLTSVNAIKVCFSSRPWNVFKSYYGENHGQKLHLQDLTQDDIRRFASEEIAKGANLNSESPAASRYQDLIIEIQERSDGVFLWVFLVVRSLLRGIRNEDTLAELQTRLRELPTELETYFQHILDSCETVYRYQAARLYLIRLAVTDHDLHVLDVAAFAEKDHYFALNQELVQSHMQHFCKMLDSLKRRILVRCQDLLEIDYGERIQYLHRTVIDFLETKEVHEQLESRVDQGFSPHFFICNALLLQMRAIDEGSVDCRVRKGLNDFWKIFWLHVMELPVSYPGFHHLLLALEKTIVRNQQNRSTDYASGRLWWSDLLHGEHYKGWLADTAIKRGVQDFLSSKIGSYIDITNEDGSTKQVPPLEVALLHMRSDKRLDEIRHLLAEGADPNEPDSMGGTIWIAYLEAISQPGALYVRRDHVQVVTALLRSGADPALDSDSDFLYQVLVLAETPGHEMDELESLRRSCQRAKLKRKNEDADGLEQPIYNAYGSEVSAQGKEASHIHGIPTHWKQRKLNIPPSSGPRPPHPEPLALVSGDFFESPQSPPAWERRER